MLSSHVLKPTKSIDGVWRTLSRKHAKPSLEVRQNCNNVYNPADPTKRWSWKTEHCTKIPLIIIKKDKNRSSDSFIRLNFKIVSSASLGQMTSKTKATVNTILSSHIILEMHIPLWRKKENKIKDKYNSLASNLIPNS